jgi:formylglycine-generating enzyme required for sulfatase activity
MTGTNDSDKDNGDYLGYGVYADTLWSRIQAALDKDLGSDKTLGDDPLVVGIFGEWGAGKSKLLKLILEKAERLASQKERARSGKDGGFGEEGLSLTVPVFFQPWKYEHEENLLVPLLLHIVQSLQETARRGQTPGENLRQKAQLAGDAAFAALPDIVTGFEFLHNNVAVDLALAGDPTGAAALLKTAGWLAKLKRKVGLSQTTLRKDFRVTTDGRFYYNFHAALKDITRPSGKPEVLEKLRLSKGLRINFVIFIDDLDRCLPEKAVQTLELIKTVFNLESFAFVLALDEEVVERGIGHRYKDYALVNKKPEMPITGFEYLEKIVHLPFRLPALSRQEGLEFLERYERELLASRKTQRAGGYKPMPWFSKRDCLLGFSDALPVDYNPASGSQGFLEAAIDSLSARAEVRASGGRVDVHLGHAALNGFDAFVPRKLIRVVELFHQVVEVAHERGRPVDQHLGGERDPRWVLVFVMLQLFQPDLYRLLRRLGRGVDTLRDAFADKSLRADMADMELLNWACYGAKPVPTDLQAAITAIANNQDEGIRSPAQRIRLPIVERLLDHRAAQRHVFDPLKLFAGLSDPRAPFPTTQTRAYFSLLSRVSGELDELRQLDVVLSQQAPADEADAGTTPLGAEGQVNRETRFAVDLDQLFLSLISAEPSERRNLAQTVGLQLGQRLSTKQVRDLADQLKNWLSGAKDEEKADRMSRASDGLLYLAPFLALGDGEVLWNALGKGEVPWDPNAPYASTEQLKNAFRDSDLWVALRLDKRFNPERFYLPRQRFKDHTEAQEPIESFVFVPKGQFTLGAKGEGFTDNPLNEDATIKSDFYIARYLTTVDQYACFIQEGGYEAVDGQKPDWWDTLGWAWRTGQWDSKVKDKAYREHLARRKPELRGAPMQWTEQLAYGSRPVRRLNWFEARAYANWLTLRLKSELDRLLPGYAFRLPTEVQWERAARARDLSSSDDRQYPWGGADGDPAHLRANIHQSGVERPSLVGLFPPNPLGLYDLSGNLWEWQNNLYLTDGCGQHKGLTADVFDLKTDNDLINSDCPALRGGAWSGSADLACVSIRNWGLAGYWRSSVGFRVVLSLPD